VEHHPRRAAGHHLNGRDTIQARLAGSGTTYGSVAFELDGQAFVALNGGPMFMFNEAISLQVYCDTQDEVDHYWERLSAGGDAEAQQCGWLKDKYGVSWQVVPTALIEMMGDPDAARSQRATEAMLRMKKFDIAQLTRAHEGA